MTEELYRKLITYNEWWSTGKVRQELAKPFRRRLFEKLTKRIENKRILEIIGPRRVGKTTLMFQMIDHLLTVKRVEPKNILYVSLDETTIRDIDELISAYTGWVLKGDIGKKKVYFFLDEIHFLDGWAVQLKKSFDLAKEIQYIVTGSSAAWIHKKSGESLVGRVDDHVLMPFSFGEYLSFNGMEPPDAPPVFGSYEKLKDAYAAALLREKALTQMFHKYLLDGGFPELCMYDNLLLKYEYIAKDVFDKVVYKDIPMVYGVREPKPLRALLEIAAKESCQRVNLTSLSGNLGLTRPTTSNYLFYLESAFIVSLSNLYAKSAAKEQRARKKIYIRDISLKNALLRTRDAADAAELGKSVETVVYNHLKNFTYENFGTSVAYWAERHKEVDIVLKLHDAVIPIEVKYRSQISKSDISGLLAFFKRFNCKKGIVVTRDLFERREINGAEIVFVPAWVFLLGL